MIHDSKDKTQTKFRSSLEAARSKKALEKYDEVSEKWLERLPLACAQELRCLFREKGVNEIGKANPEFWADNTRAMVLASLVQIYTMLSDLDLRPQSLSDFGGPETLLAIKAKVDSGRWTSGTAIIPLANIKKLFRLKFGTCPPGFNERLNEYKSLPSRDLSARTHLPDQHRKAALALGAIAAIFAEVGRPRAITLARDAAILGFNSIASLRFSELHNLKVSDVTERKTLNGKTFLSVNAMMNKTGTSRTVNIFDEQIVELILPLLNAPRDASLFRKRNILPIPRSTFGAILARLGFVADGKLGSANVTRQSNAKAAPSIAEATNRLGQKVRSNVTKKHYWQAPDR